MTGAPIRRFRSRMCFAALVAGRTKRRPSGNSNSEIMSRINSAVRPPRARDRLLAIVVSWPWDESVAVRLATQRLEFLFKSCQLLISQPIQVDHAVSGSAGGLEQLINLQMERR